MAESCVYSMENSSALVNESSATWSASKAGVSGVSKSATTGSEALEIEKSVIKKKKAEFDALLFSNFYPFSD